MTNKNQAHIVKNLIDAVYLANKIIVTALLMFKPDGIVEKIEGHYKELEDLLDLDLSNDYFLNHKHIAKSLPQLKHLEQHINSMVSLINMALATYRIFSATQLNHVLNALFTMVVPAGIDIKQHVMKAYSELLHKVGHDACDLTAFIKNSKTIRPDWIEPHILAEYEEQVLIKLHTKKEPMKQGDLIMLWELAFSSMLRQSTDIRKVRMVIPVEVIEASHAPQKKRPAPQSGKRITRSATKTLLPLKKRRIL